MTDSEKLDLLLSDILSRNLHEAMKPSKEAEILSLKVRKLESDVEDLKVKIG